MEYDLYEFYVLQTQTLLWIRNKIMDLSGDNDNNYYIEDNELEDKSLFIELK